MAHSGPWGFELSAISVPVLLLHGRQDQFVPFGHGEWLAAHIPGVEARLTDNDGHLTLEQPHPRGARLAGRAFVTRWSAGPRPP